MDLTLLEELAADLFSSAALKQHVVWHHDGGTAVDLEQRLHVLDEVQLLV